MCRVPGISRAGFYKWLHKTLSDRAKEDLRLLELIQHSHQGSYGVYGLPRIFLYLREVGERCGENRVARVMRTHKIKAIIGYKSHHSVAGRPSFVAPKTLNREFSVDSHNIAWVTDITYIRPWQGWLYLAAVMDWYSRRIVGWSMKPTMGKEIVLDALCMAINRRQPTQRVLVHSDQGSQYGSGDWLNFCRAHQLEPSMSRLGNCWNNAATESFFGSLKKERIEK